MPTLLMRVHDRPHARKNARRDAVDEQSLTDLFQLREGFAAQVAGTPHHQPFELHPAEPITHHGFGDAEDLADPGLPASDPITRVSRRGEAGNQSAVEVEEGAHLGARRIGGDLREGGGRRLRMVDGHVVVLYVPFRNPGYKQVRRARKWMVDFELDAAQNAWLAKVRDFLQANVTPALRSELAEHGQEFPDGEVASFRSKIGARGWFGLNWPAEYGGLGLGAIYQHLLMREFEYWGVPGPDLTVTSVAPMIMRHGTEQNKAEFLPPIARGELTCAVGYSEPDAGTDLASLRTRAVQDGDEWVITGSKIWNSGAQRATHEWLCVRTDPNAPRHRGISVIMVPVDSPGVEIRPLYAWSGYRTNEVFFDEVRVPVGNLIGEINRGWTYITGALDLERGALTNAGDMRRALDELTELAGRPRHDGSIPLQTPSFRRRLAQAEADVEAAMLMGYQAASLLDSGVIPTVEVSVEKVFSSELRQRIADLAIDLLGPDGLLAYRSPGAPADGKFERLYRVSPLMRFGGGTNEVLRDVIAQRGHGMPSYGR